MSQKRDLTAGRSDNGSTSAVFPMQNFRISFVEIGCRTFNSSADRWSNSDCEVEPPRPQGFEFSGDTARNKITSPVRSLPESHLSESSLESTLGFVCLDMIYELNMSLRRDLMSQIDIEATLASRRQPNRRRKRDTAAPNATETIAVRFGATRVAASGGGVFIPPNTIDFGCASRTWTVPRHSFAF